MEEKQKRELNELARKVEIEASRQIASHPEDGYARSILRLAKGCQRLIDESGDVS